MGSSLALELCALGADVMIIDSLVGGLGGNIVNVQGFLGKLKVSNSDLRDTDSISKLIEQADIVFHYAGQGSHSLSMSEPGLDLELNIVATLKLLEAIRRSKNNPRLIYAGTRGQIGPTAERVDESYEGIPTSVYGVNKSAAEKYCLVYSLHYGMQVVSLRFTNVYGPRHQMKHAQQGVLNWFIRLALEGKTIQVWDGRQKRDYLYVDDATDAALRAGQETEVIGECIYICSGESISLLNAVKCIVETAGSGSYAVKPYPEGQKRYEVGDVLLSNDKARKRLGWSPSVKFKEGVRRTIQFYERNLKLYV